MKVRRDSWLYNLLTKPLFVMEDRERAEWSMYTYREWDDGVYTLSLLGVLNGVFGLELTISDKPTRRQIKQSNREEGS